jgi:hypothetical protein
MVNGKDKPDTAMSFQFSGHAVQRMFSRGISETEVIQVICKGDTIAKYPDDTPFPSYLVLGTVGTTAIHVVYALDWTGMQCLVITAYVPDPLIWMSDYRTRRPK